MATPEGHSRGHSQRPRLTAILLVPWLGHDLPWHIMCLGERPSFLLDLVAAWT